ncbi:hypothetical protein PG990_010664 [Apiospora arundinis]
MRFDVVLDHFNRLVPIQFLVVGWVRPVAYIAHGTALGGWSCCDAGLWQCQGDLDAFRSNDLALQVSALHIGNGFLFQPPKLFTPDLNLLQRHVCSGAHTLYVALQLLDGPFHLLSHMSDAVGGRSLSENGDKTFGLAEEVGHRPGANGEPVDGCVPDVRDGFEGFGERLLGPLGIQPSRILGDELYPAVELRRFRAVPTSPLQGLGHSAHCMLVAGGL